MLSRLDGENIYLLRSDNIHFWNESTFVRGPKHPWEFVQIGNCGSPIETEKGWVLLPTAWADAPVLDGRAAARLEDPSRVIGDLVEPLLMPEPADATATCPTWSILAARCGMETTSSFPTPLRTRISARSVFRFPSYSRVLRTDRRRSRTSPQNDACPKSPTCHVSPEASRRGTRRPARRSRAPGRR